MVSNFTPREVRLKNKKFTEWIKEIYATNTEGLDCHQTEAVLPEYVDALTDNQPIDSIIVKTVEEHLKHCPDCKEVFDGLKYVAEHAEQLESDVDSVGRSVSETAVAAD